MEISSLFVSVHSALCLSVCFRVSLLSCAFVFVAVHTDCLSPYLSVSVSLPRSFFLLLCLCIFPFLFIPLGVNSYSLALSFQDFAETAGSSKNRAELSTHICLSGFDHI